MTDIATPRSAGSIERIELDVADGTRLPAQIVRPHKPATGEPGVLVFQDAYGVTGFLRDVALRFAELGFTAICPEFYHRTNVSELPYSDVKMEGNRPHMRALTTEGQLADIAAAYAWLRAEGAPAAKIAAIGFCMGGRQAYLANAQHPLAAAISYYGGGIPKSFEFAPQQHGPILFYWAGRDVHIPPEQAAEVEDGLNAAGVRQTHVWFSQAEHGFFCHARDWVYDASSARQSWAMTLEFLRVQGVLADDAR